ncbi:MAG: TRAP transporter TatT component family protein [Pyrinomonadaceae bacterium]
MKLKIRARVVCYGLTAIALVCASTSCASNSTAERSANETAAAPAPPPSSTVVTPAELVAQAVQLYAQRDDLARVREGLAKLRGARAAEPNNYEAAWQASKLNYYLGDNTTNEEERDKAFEDGVEAARAAVKLQPEKPDGHFWLGANLGGQAKVSVLSGMADTDEIRQEMETVIKLDEGYLSGSAHMALGQVYLETPRMMGGDAKKAVEQMEKGLKFGETNALLRLRLAEAYLAVDRKADARKQLDIILNMTPDQNYLPEHKKAVAEARKLLEKTA